MNHKLVPTTPKTPHTTDQLKGVSRTLLLPLMARAYAKQLLPNTPFDDPTSLSVCQKLDLSLKDVSQDAFPLRLCIVRSVVLERALRSFSDLESRPILLLACGLDTLPTRLSQPNARWICADLAPVVEVRKRLIHDTQEVFPIHFPDDIDAIRDFMAETPPVIVLEGLLPYLQPQEAFHCLRLLIDAAPHGADILLDGYHPSLLAFSRLGATFKKMKVDFHFGARHPKLLSEALPRLELRESWDIISPIPWWLRKRCWFPRLFAAHDSLAFVAHYTILPKEPG